MTANSGVILVLLLVLLSLLNLKFREKIKVMKMQLLVFLGNSDALL